MTDYKKLFKEALTPNYLKEEDRATRVDKMMSGEYDDEDYKDSKRYDDVRAELDENEKFDHIARAEYGKPFSLLSIAQKQEMLSYMNRETEKEFETDFERRRKGDYSDDMEDGMTDYERGRMDESVDEGTCGYGEDGVIGDKPAGPDLNEAEIPLYLTSNKAFEKAVNDSVSFNDFEERVYGILGPKYFKLAKVENPGAMKDFYDSIRGNRPKFMEEELFTPNEIGDEAVEKESNSAAYESLQESLRKKLKKRLS